MGRSKGHLMKSIQEKTWEELKHVRVSPEQFTAWLEQAELGTEINYHNGLHLMVPNPEDPTKDMRIAVGSAAFKAAAAGQVFLYRQRIDKTRFAWIARRVSKETGKRIKPENY